MFRNFFIIIFVFLVGFSAAQSQSGTLKGRITDDIKGTPVAYAHIVVKDSNRIISQVISDTGGYYTKKKLKAGFMFYPNPTPGKLTVEVEGKISELFLTDISGKLLSKYKPAAESRFEIDMEKYSTGIYYLKFYDNNKWYSGKIVLTH